MNKKALVTIHGWLFLLAGIIIGAGTMYYIITRGILPVPGA